MAGSLVRPFLRRGGARGGDDQPLRDGTGDGQSEPGRQAADDGGPDRRRLAAERMQNLQHLEPGVEPFYGVGRNRRGGRDRRIFVRRGPGIRVEETWDTIGMRATGSHDLVLENAFVPEDELLDRSDSGRPRTDDGDGWLLHIPACYIGIAHAARDFAVGFARDYRPNSLPGPIAELPYIRQQIGQMEADLITARTLLYAMADRWDRYEAGRPALKPELGLVKYVATNHAIRIVDIAMRIVGGASLSRKLPLERMYRDVRAGLHNPPMDDAALQRLADRALAE